MSEKESEGVGGRKREGEEKRKNEQIRVFGRGKTNLVKIYSVWNESEIKIPRREKERKCERK